MANIEQMFRISLEQEMCDVFYYQQVAHDKKDLIHKVPWGATIIRNCLPGGDLLRFKTIRDYELFQKETNIELWLLLPLKIFRHTGSLYGVYCCPQCDSMAGTEQLRIDQDPQGFFYFLHIKYMNGTFLRIYCLVYACIAELRQPFWKTGEISGRWKYLTMTGWPGLFVMKT